MAFAGPLPTSTAPATGYHESTITIAARQERVLTQTIRLSATTFVSLLTLGGDSEDNTAGSPSDATPVYDYGDSLSSAEIGGILGGIVAVVAIALVVCFCMAHKRQRRSRRGRGNPYYYDDETTDTSGSNTTPPRRRRDVPPPPQRPTRASRQPRPHPTMPAPPAPTLRINREQPWTAKYAGPRRTMR